MSHTKLGNFYENEICVKLKENCDLSYFEECGWCDYRVGCDICERGQAWGFKTNFLDIIKKEDYFLINDLDIIMDDVDGDLKLPLYYETTDEKTIKIVFDCYNEFEHLDEYVGTDLKYSLSDNMIASSGITSIFKDYQENIKRIHLCGLCLKWLNILHKDIYDNFNKINPLKIYWDGVITDYLEDVIEFKNTDDTQLFQEIKIEI